MKNIGILLIIVFLSACSGINNLKKVDNIIMQDTLTSTILSVELEEPEVKTIIEARQLYERLRIKWQSPITHYGINPFMNELMADYTLLVDKYNLIYNIVLKNANKYSEEDISYMLIAKKQFERLDKSMKKAQFAQDVKQTAYHFFSMIIQAITFMRI